MQALGVHAQSNRGKGMSHQEYGHGREPREKSKRAVSLQVSLSRLRPSAPVGRTRPATRTPPPTPMLTSPPCLQTRERGKGFRQVH